MPIGCMVEPIKSYGDTFPDYSLGSELFINIEAYDPDGDLEYVQVYLNGELLGDAQSGYDNTYICKWNVTQENDEFFEMFNLQCNVKDNDGNMVNSSTLMGYCFR